MPNYETIATDGIQRYRNLVTAASAAVALTHALSRCGISGNRLRSMPKGTERSIVISEEYWGAAVPEGESAFDAVVLGDAGWPILRSDDNPTAT